LAGLAHWVNEFNGKSVPHIDKTADGLHAVKDYIDKQYEEGRVTKFSDMEVERIVRRLAPELLKK